MKTGSRGTIRRKLRAISDVRNWTEPVIDAYFRIANQFFVGHRRGFTNDTAPGNPDVTTVLWPKQATPGWASGWLEPVAESLSQRYNLEQRDIPQPYKDLLIFRIQLPRNTLGIAIDTTDYVSRIELDCLADVDVYFKLQFRKDGYDDNRVLPGGFVTRGSRLYSYLPLLRNWSLDQSKKRFDVYGRFGPQFGFDVRSKAITILKQQDRFQFAGDINRVLYARYLREAARARVCIDLPGNGPFCFRLIEYLALGSCIIAYPHSARFPVPLEDRKHIIYCKEDMSDLVDLCEEYVGNPDERIRIGRNAAEYFDSNLRVDRLAEYYVTETIKRKT